MIPGLLQLVVEKENSLRPIVRVALVEVDGRRILFDTGERPETVLQNALELGIDLSGVTDIVLSHHHGDHAGGLMTLRKALARQNPKALSRVHVADGIFLDRTAPDGSAPRSSMAEVRAAYEAAGGTFVVHSRPSEILPGVWVGGPVPRPHPERNWPRAGRIKTPQGMVEDSIPEDMSLYIDTPQGLVVITGCGHAGTVNTVQHARSVVREAPAYAVIGGLHLFASSDQEVEWTATRLKEFGLAHLLGARPADRVGQVHHHVDAVDGQVVRAEETRHAGAQLELVEGLAELRLELDDAAPSGAAVGTRQP